MGRWTYYSPLWLGALLVLAMNQPLREPISAAPPWVQWTALIVAAVVFAVQCQVLMIGVQGVFAQVLPVPRGRSIRGRPALVGGGFLIAWYGLGLVGGFLLRHEVYLVGWILAGAALAALAGALVVYVWSLPAAVRDFSGEEHS